MSELLTLAKAQSLLSGGRLVYSRYPNNPITQSGIFVDPGVAEAFIFGPADNANDYVSENANAGEFTMAFSGMARVLIGGRFNIPTATATDFIFGLNPTVNGNALLQNLEGSAFWFKPDLSQPNGYQDLIIRAFNYEFSAGDILKFELFYDLGGGTAPTVINTVTGDLSFVTNGGFYSSTDWSQSIEIYTNVVV